AMYVLATLMEEAGLSLAVKPRYIVTGSDALLPSHEAVIRRVFGAPVTEQYGMAEFCGNMSKCERGVFHVDFECCYVEAFPVGEGDLSHLLFTGWGNAAMPFIRYEVGDLGRPAERLCECGRQSQGFISVEG